MAIEDSSTELTSLTDAYVIFNENTIKTLKTNMDNLSTKFQDKENMINLDEKANARKEHEYSKKLLKRCIKSRKYLDQLKKSPTDTRKGSEWQHNFLQNKLKLRSFKDQKAKIKPRADKNLNRIRRHNDTVNCK